jgi:hypothetical protein
MHGLTMNRALDLAVVALIGLAAVSRSGSSSKACATRWRWLSVRLLRCSFTPGDEAS